MFRFFSVLLLSSVAIAVQQDYGIACDAGSTATRCTIFKWDSRSASGQENPRSTPTQVAFSEKTKVPLDDNNNQADVDAYLQPLIAWAKSELQPYSDRWSTFPIWLKATAGMRVNSPRIRQNVMLWARAFLKDSSKNPFLFTDDQAVILSGEEEGVDGWVGVNVILSKTTSPPGETVGALDCGGMSTQVTFAYIPSSDILGDYQGVNVWGSSYRLYSHSYLKFGTNAILARVAEKIRAKGQSSNPCVNSGYNMEISMFDGTKLTQSGSSNGAYCAQLIESLLLLNSECFFGKECAVEGEYMPPPPSSMTFYAFSAFAYNLESLEMGPYTPRKVGEIALEICSKTWAEVNQPPYNRNTKPKYLNMYCLTLTYIHLLLTKAYKFPEDTTKIIFTNEVKSQRLGWLAGSVFLDVNKLPVTNAVSKPATVKLCLKMKVRAYASGGTYYLSNRKFNGKEVYTRRTRDPRFIYWTKSKKWMVAKRPGANGWFATCSKPKLASCIRGKIRVKCLVIGGMNRAMNVNAGFAEEARGKSDSKKNLMGFVLVGVFSLACTVCLVCSCWMASRLRRGKYAGLSGDDGTRVESYDDAWATYQIPI